MKNEWKMVMIYISLFLSKPWAFFFFFQFVNFIVALTTTVLSVHLKTLFSSWIYNE